MTILPRPSPWVWQSATKWPPPHAVVALVDGPIGEPISLDEGKLRAGLDWSDGDPRDALMMSFIKAARHKVEQDTGWALLTQTLDVWYDHVTPPVVLPEGCRPLQAVTSITSTDSQGIPHVLDPTQYLVDVVSGRIGLAPNGVWPTDLRGFQPWTIRVVAGWPSVELLQLEAPMLVQAVGLLTAHFATMGRDAVTVGLHLGATPFGYDDLIASYLTVRLE